jgi:transposase InsO family protein
MKEQFELHGNILFYRWQEVSRDASRLLIVVPRRLRHEIMQVAHDNVCSGHPGPEKTLLLLQRRFFWPGMRADINLYVKTCHLCCRHKRAKQRPRSPLKKFHAGEPMERVHIDILGPLAETEQQNKYVLVMIDQFTKWVELKALPEQTAETVARAFIEEFVCRMGCALQVHSDQGSNFESLLFQEVCDLLQMAKTRTTPYRPSANGQVERMNREILTKLRIFIDGKQALWDRYLPYVGMAMRATTNRSTGFTPNMMMLGREVTLPVDLLAQFPKESNAEPAPYVQQLQEQLRDVHECARNKLGVALQERKRTYDQKVLEDVYDLGDLVYLLNGTSKKGTTRKLQPVYLGPFSIVRKISDALYVITGIRRHHQVVHHDRLRRYADRNIPFWAWRDRRKLFEAPEAVEMENVLDEEADLELSSLFPDNTDDASDHEEPETSEPDAVDLVIQDEPVPLAETSDDRQLPPSKRSGRERRQPIWLKDFLTHRGIRH